MSPSAGTPRILRRGSLLWIFLFFFSLYALLSSGNLGLDSRLRYEVALNLLAGNGPVAPQSSRIHVVGPDGNTIPYTRYPLGQSLVLVPYHLLVVYPATFWLPDRLQERARELLLSVTWFPATSALGIILLILLAQELGARPRTARRLGYLVGIASPYFWYGTAPLEPTQMFCILAAGLLLGLRGIGRQRATLLWAGVFVLTLTTYARPAMAIEVTGFTLLLAVLSQTEHRWKRRWVPICHLGLAFLLFGGLSFAFYAIDNSLRFGHPLRSGYHVFFEIYQVEPFSNPFLKGLWQPLIGPNWGILWICPMLLALWVVPWRRVDFGIRATVATAAVLWLVLVLFLARYVSFAGNENFGPRMQIHLLPFLLLGLLPLLEPKHPPRWFLTIVLASIAIQFAAISLSWNLEARLATKREQADRLFLEMRDLRPPGLLSLRPAALWWKLNGTLDARLAEALGREPDAVEMAALQWDFFWIRSWKQGRSVGTITALLALMLLTLALFAAWRARLPERAEFSAGDGFQQN